MTLTHAQIRLLTNVLAQLNKQSTLPCLSHLYFTPAGSHTLITATDLENALYWPIPTATALPRPASCPREWFLKIARSVRVDGHLELQLDPTGQRLHALPSTAPSSRSPELSLPIAKAPSFSTSGFTLGGHLSAHTLRAAHKALPFMSSDQTRYVLNGVHIQKDGHIVATDGRRLAHQQTLGTSLPADIILPPSVLKILAGHLDKTAPDLLKTLVWFKHDTLLASLPGSTALLHARLIGGTYPNWRRVMPPLSECTAIITLNEDFLPTARHHQRQNLSQAELRIQLDLHPDRQVWAHCYTEKPGTGHIPLCDPFLAGTHIGHKTFQITMNGTFLLDCVDFAGPSLRLIDEASPLINGDPGQRQSICMPLRNSPVVSS